MEMDISIDEIRKLTKDILSGPKVDLEIPQEELYQTSKIQVKAYHYNFDTGYKGIYELLEDEFCDRSTALIFYWLNRPLYYLNNPDSKNPIHEDGRNLKKYIEEKITKGNFKKILQFTPIKFIEGPMGMQDELVAKEPFLKELPVEIFLPVGMNYTTTGTCN
jgi:hypothetical protein